MDFIQMDMDRIIRITENELLFYDDRWDTNSLDLRQCRDRFRKHLVEHQSDFPSLNIAAIQDEGFRCVADRDITCTDGPYFEFYDWPHIRFVLKWKKNVFTKLLDFIGWNWKAKYIMKFHNIQRQITEAGWTSFDLS